MLHKRICCIFEKVGIEKKKVFHYLKKPLYEALANETFGELSKLNLQLNGTSHTFTR